MNHSRLAVSAAALCFAVLFARTDIRVCAAPSIGTTSPQSVAPGSTTDITLRGNDLTGASLLWSSFPGKSELAPDVKDNGKNARQVTWRVSVPKDVPVGIHGIRVAGPQGASPLKLIMVDDLPSVAQAGGNTSVEKAQMLQLPVAADGSVPNLSRSCFRIKAEAGQTVSIEVVARRLGSALDPLLRVLNAEGREIAWSDDEPGLRGDARLRHTFNKAGEYVIEVRDIRYKGGGGYFYRLRIGDFPLLTSPYPLGVTRGSTAKITFPGPHTHGVGEVEVRAPSNPDINWINASAKHPDGNSSGFAALRIEDAPVSLESEPNDQLSNATPVALGHTINGRIEKPGDVDHFRFAAKKGQKFRFTAVTRRQGTPTSLYFRLLKADGGQVASKEDFGVGDAFFDYTFPADGDYTLAVEELHHRGGPHFTYAVQTRPVSPGFELSAGTDTINAGAGSTARVSVNVIRRGYNGPIEVAATDLPAGVVSHPTVAGPGAKSVVLTVSSSDQAAPGTLIPVKVVGRAKIGEEAVEVVASTEESLKSRMNTLPWAPQNLSEDVAIAVGPRPPIRLRREPAEAVFGKNLSAKVKIVVERDEGFDEAIKLAVTPEPKKGGLPGNVTATVKPIAKGKNETVVTFSANAKAPLGDFTAVLTGTIKQGKTTVTQTTPGITLRLQPPMTLSLAPAAEKLTPGGELKAKVTVHRNPALKGDVALTFQNLPKGVTVSDARIPAGQNETEVTITASKDAPTGSVDKLNAKGEVTVGENKYSAVSPNVILTIEQ